MREPVMVVAGPTASGKTPLAIALAERHNLEIVSIDSRQLYQGMAIGSAAPTLLEQQQIPHHLVDCLDPAEVMTAGGFGRMAREVIEDIESRGKGALLTGGSGMYLRAVLGGLDEELPQDPRIRKRLEREAEEMGSHQLHARLHLLDPVTADTTMPGDALRLVRALEVIEITGKRISALRTTGGQPSVRATVMVLNFEPKILEERIRLRVATMIEAGLEKEVRDLLQRQLPPGQPALKSVGYAETLRYFRGELSRDEWIEAIVVNTRRYAKRQRTWFRSTPGAVHIAVTPESSLMELITEAEALFALKNLGKPI